jgi:hypothetical protein
MTKQQYMPFFQLRHSLEDGNPEVFCGKSWMLEGQTRPYTLPVSKVVWTAIRDRVHQEHGVTFLSASRFGIEHDIDMVILLTASEPVSAGFISDLKRVANKASAANLNIGVYVFQEAQIKHSKF